MKEFVRFCIVGAVCTCLDAAIYYLVVMFAPYQAALTAGYLLSLIVNYFLTVYWTFQTKPTAGNAIGVIAAHLFNLFVVRMSLMYFFVRVIELSERLAYLPTLAISVVTNFLIIKYVVNRLK